MMKMHNSQKHRVPAKGKHLRKWGKHGTHRTYNMVLPPTSTHTHTHTNLPHAHTPKHKQVLVHTRPQFTPTKHRQAVRQTAYIAPPKQRQVNTSNHIQAPRQVPYITPQTHTQQQQPRSRPDTEQQKMARLKEKCCMELVHSEIQYVQHLQAVVEVFVTPLMIDFIDLKPGACVFD